jgi:MEDS: MEthanogen/methylotroph, DcmR Sensory domain
MPHTSRVKSDSAQTPPQTLERMEPSYENLLRRPKPQAHLVEFHGVDDQALNRNAGKFLFEGWKLGDGVLVIGESGRNRVLAQEISNLGGDCELAARQGQLRFLDAHETLAKFMIDGQPYWGRFESAIGAVLGDIRAAVGHGGCRGYGEMVGILWKAGQFAAAIRLETFWNKLLSRSSASIFCGYPIDIFAPDFNAEAVDALLCAHTHVLPASCSGTVENALHQALDAVLGPEADEIRPRMAQNRQTAWAEMPKAEGNILWVRNNLPTLADEILARARQFYQGARQTGAYTSCTF